MKLGTQLATDRVTDALSHTDRVRYFCGLAREFETVGEYEAACEALADFWPNRSGNPMVDGLDDEEKAEVLLRVGAVSGWLGSAHSAGGQEHAKDLLTQSIEIFKQQGRTARVGEVQSELALCYWREGGFDEARVNLDQALECVKDEDFDLKASILIRFSVVERRAGCFHEALKRLAVASLRTRWMNHSPAKCSCIQTRQ